MIVVRERNRYYAHESAEVSKEFTLEETQPVIEIKGVQKASEVV